MSNRQIANECPWPGVIALCLVSALFTAIATRGLIEGHYRREAIKHGAAEYDSKTGQWQWIDRDAE